jgi:hypothetical protein
VELHTGLWWSSVKNSVQNSMQSSVQSSVRSSVHVAPFCRALAALSQSFCKALGLHPDAELATLLGLAEQLAEVCNIDALRAERVIYNSIERYL